MTTTKGYTERSRNMARTYPENSAPRLAWQAISYWIDGGMSVAQVRDRVAEKQANPLTRSMYRAWTDALVTLDMWMLTDPTGTHAAAAPAGLSLVEIMAMAQNSAEAGDGLDVFDAFYALMGARRADRVITLADAIEYADERAHRSQDFDGNEPTPDERRAWGVVHVYLRAAVVR